MSFLNAVLDLTGKRAIEDVEVLNPYRLSIKKNLDRAVGGRDAVEPVFVGGKAGGSRRLSPSKRRCAPKTPSR